MDRNFSILKELELALQKPAVRQDKKRLEELLHPEFVEFGRSGRTYTKVETMAALANPGESTNIWAQDFHLMALSAGVSLLTYKSAHVRADGSLERHTLRGSIWKKTTIGWQLIFHQGTPTGAFNKESCEHS